MLDDWEILCEVEEAVEDMRMGDPTLKPTGEYQVVAPSGLTVDSGLGVPTLRRLQELAQAYPGADVLTVEGEFSVECRWPGMAEGDEVETAPTDYWWRVAVATGSLAGRSSGEVVSAAS